ncbi:flagellar biosynthesis protein FlhA [Paraburkholderia bannensis]|uniref:flagellar biosynthesis protein FlhA n=1 Tax=Paraburkholderia bannensis TaxID=765414 RepID=UPI002AC356D6|nr:flagellar biosynthesis protein FlhA [Paraburkholderia bannensis]
MNRTALRHLDALPLFLQRHADLTLGASLVSILVLLILPVPPFLLDFFICVSFCASFVMLCATTYAPRAASLPGFPSLLLMTTLLRLALAIASTKMILMHAHAGRIIDAFGDLVAGGNVAVGIVVFLVLCAIQFIVVAKGADRIAEVAARFTLDGIPGRQMSIDADLRSGLIGAERAAQLRAGLERDTYFYGSLDGAMKFVKGDTIAGFVVAIVNIVGGLSIGIVQHGMSFGDALQVYTILTIGDGLVSQIPSLIVSIAAGLLVTRVSPASGATTLGRDLFEQLSLQPEALLMAAACCAALALIPGFPHVQFALIALLLGGLARLLIQAAKRAQSDASAPMPALARDGSRYVPHMLDNTELGTSAPLRLRLGKDAFGALRPEALNRILAGLRRDLNQRLGLPFPGIALLIDARLEPERYIIDVDDVAFASGSLFAQHVLVSGRAPDVTIDGASGYRPGFEKSVWIAASTASAQDASKVVIGAPDEVLAHHLSEVFERRAARLMGTQEARFLLNRIGGEFPELVAQVASLITTVQLAAVLRQLLQQHVSIRNLRGILEAILRVPHEERTIDHMVRECRIELGPQLVRAHADLNTWEIHAAVLEPAWESELESHIRRGPQGEPYCALDYEQLSALQHAIARATLPVRVMITTAVLRPHLARTLSSLGIVMNVIAIEEIPQEVYRVRTIATFARP